MPHSKITFEQVISQIATNVLSLLRAERKAMRDMVAQVEKKLSKSPKVHLFLKLSLSFQLHQQLYILHWSVGHSVGRQSFEACELVNRNLSKKAQRFLKLILHAWGRTNMKIFTKIPFSRFANRQAMAGTGCRRAGRWNLPLDFPQQPPKPRWV